jgi:phage terminase large subunit-like protein
VRRLPRRAPQVQNDTVSLVRRLRAESVDVYDIQVEGNHNFFANQVLTHNCVIIDDPLNAMDAYSDKKRSKANKWLDEAASNRLTDPRAGSIVIIMQRLHAGDMSGHVLDQGTYEHLCLPSRFEPKRKYQTSVGTDWRTEPGELLFPELFTPDVMDAEEVRMGPLAFAGQHQQSPSPAAGNMFSAEMLCQTVDQDSKTYTFWPMSYLWDALSNPATKRVCEAYLSFDTATKEKTKNDFTAGCLSVCTGDGYVYVLPLVLKRMQIPEVTRTIAKAWMKWRVVLGEGLKGVRIEEGAGTAVVQYLRTLRSEAKLKMDTPNAGWTPEEWKQFLTCDPVVPLPYQTTQERVGRTMQIVPFVSGMNVRLLEAPLSQTWLAGLMGFPNMVHDDETQAFYAAVQPFVSLATGKPVVTPDEWDASMQTPEEMD